MCYVCLKPELNNVPVSGHTQQTIATIHNLARKLYLCIYYTTSNYTKKRRKKIHTINECEIQWAFEFKQKEAKES